MDLNACVASLQASHPDKDVVSLVGGIFEDWKKHCKEHNRKMKQKQKEAFFQEVLKTFPQPPPPRYSTKTSNHALSVQYPLSQHLVWKGEGGWIKTAELRKTQMGKKRKGQEVFVYETKNPKKKFSPLVSDRELAPSPGNLVGTVRFVECKGVNEYTPKQLSELVCLSPQSLSQAVRKGYRYVWEAENPRAFKNPIELPVRASVVWTTTPMGVPVPKKKKKELTFGLGR